MNSGLGNNGNHLFDGLERSERLQFPVYFDLKVIMDATIPDHENKEQLVQILDELKISSHRWHERLSASGRFITFTINIELTGYDQMQSLYQKLRGIPGIKFAI
jgi:putative lipoic acid-binding regulatory protein